MKGNAVAEEKPVPRIVTADVCVIGAGIIGITTALELQARGADVVLVDRGEPGAQTSFGNAGVLSASTVLNVNNPGLLKALPSLITGRARYFTYDFQYAVYRLPWLISFFRYATKRHLVSTANSLRALQALSVSRHEELINEASAESIYEKKGWLKVYRDEHGFASSKLERRLLDSLELPYECLTSTDLEALEPALKPVFNSGILLKSTRSVTNPFQLCNSYLDLFRNRGGRVFALDICSIQKYCADQWVSSSHGDNGIRSSNVVIACGPWADSVCSILGYKIPMAWERGYHVNVKSPQIRLNRPVCDVQYGIVMAPQGETTRITSGVEFAHRDAPPKFTQVRRAYRDAQTAVALGAITDEKPWMGSRPTMPDGLPVVGAAPRHKGVWFNFGHQHIGMGTSSGSAVLLADEMLGQASHAMSRAFVPDRFSI